jgi:hypothetical protein
MKHTLKLIWNRRSSYSWIFTEQILVTAILMLSAVSAAEAYRKYRTPGMLNVDHTFYAGQMYGDNVPWSEISDVQKSMNAVVENLRRLPYVKGVTRGFNLAPYLRSDELYVHMNSDSVRIDDRRFAAIYKISDEFGASVLGIEMDEGAWFENRLLPDGSFPVVVTRQFADKAGWTAATGKKIPLGAKFMTVTGVASGLKQEPFAPSPVALVMPSFSTMGMNFENLIKVERGMEREFTETYYREFRRLIPSGSAEPLLIYMPSMKSMFVSQSVLPVALQAVPTLFLFIFAFIGTFGLYWMMSQKRMREFALRIALGSTKGRLMRAVIGESLLITCMAVLPALALSFFIYEYSAVHAAAVSATVSVMLLFAVVSAWYPARKVSQVNPAEALQYE